MVLELAVGFVLLVVGSYLGTTLALRGFFGREYFDPRTGEWTGEAERMSEAGRTTEEDD